MKKNSKKYEKICYFSKKMDEKKYFNKLDVD